jgi:hypothetical protein
LKGPTGLANYEECKMQFLISLHINPAVLDALTGEEKAAIDGLGVEVRQVMFADGQLEI